MAAAAAGRGDQVGGGVCQNFPLALMWAHVRTLRLADGPDEVHKRSLAHRELRKYR
jgi:acyl-CoA dehydrogenase